MKNKDVEEGRVWCWLVFLHENRKPLLSVLLGSKVGNSINVTALVSPTSSFMTGQMANQASAVQRVKNGARDHVGRGVVGAVHSQHGYPGVSEPSETGYGVFEGGVGWAGVLKKVSSDEHKFWFQLNGFVHYLSKRCVEVFASSI